MIVLLMNERKGINVIQTSRKCKKPICVADIASRLFRHPSGGGFLNISSPTLSLTYFYIRTLFLPLSLPIPPAGLILSHLLRTCLHNYALSLSFTFNLSLSSGIFPSAFKYAQVSYFFSLPKTLLWKISNPQKSCKKGTVNTHNTSPRSTNY